MIKRESTLSPRLESVISLIRDGAVISDIGCDHAYISIEAIKRKKARFAVASDIRKGPLERAEKNIDEFCKSFGVEKSVHFATVLGSGITGSVSHSPDDIIIAGMGGELIVEIIKECEYTKKSGIHLILQPMTASYDLRKYLSQNGFSILREMRECEGKKCYEIILTTYTGSPYSMSEGELTIGRKCDFLPSEFSKYVEFVKNKISKLEKILSQKRENNVDFSAEETMISELSSLIS